MIEVLCFVIGVLLGGFLVRYGLGLGVKLTYQIKEDFPPLEKEENTEQETTHELEG